MDRFFGRTIKMYEDRYKSLVRIESLDFDPMVNRYFEAQYVTSGTDESSSQTSGSIDGTNTQTRNAAVAGSSKEYPKTAMTVTTEGQTHTENTDTLGATYANEAYNNVQDAVTHSGSITDTLNGHTTNSGNTTRAGSASANSQTSGDSVANSANKVAPMSVSGLTYGSDGRKLNSPDLSYATDVSHADTTTSSTNSSTSSENGSESVTGSEVKSDVNTKVMANSDVAVKTGSVTKTTTDTINGSENDTSNSSTQTTTYAAGSVIEKEDSTTNVETVNDTNNATNESSTSGSVIKNSTSTNRYTGREGLTPQDAMMSASDYLMNYSTAFKWLCRKLESCFVMKYDI